MHCKIFFRICCSARRRPIPCECNRSIGGNTRLSEMAYINRLQFSRGKPPRPHGNFMSVGHNRLENGAVNDICVRSRLFIRRLANHANIIHRIGCVSAINPRSVHPHLLAPSRKCRQRVKRKYRKEEFQHRPHDFSPFLQTTMRDPSRGPPSDIITLDLVTPPRGQPSPQLRQCALRSDGALDRQG